MKSKSRARNDRAVILKRVDEMIKPKRRCGKQAVNFLEGLIIEIEERINCLKEELSDDEQDI